MTIAIKQITMMESIQINGRWFVFMTQHCYSDIENRVIVDDCEDCSGLNYMDHYKVTYSGVDYWVPDYTAVVESAKRVDSYQDMAQYWGDKGQDQTLDYTKDVKKFMGIDLRRNQLPQHNGDNYRFTVHETRKSKLDDNDYKPTEGDYPTCDTQ